MALLPRTFAELRSNLEKLKERAIRVLTRKQEEASSAFGDLITNRRDWLFANLPEESARYLYELHDKYEQKRLAKRIGLEVAHDYLLNASLAQAIEHITAADLARFVIKPAAARSGVGCRCIVREENGYLDLREWRRYDSLQALEREVRSEYGKLGRPDDWVVEELLMPIDGSLSLIEDYKVYCFAGRAEVIAVKKVRPGEAKYGLRWFTRAWQPVDVGIASENTDTSIEPPENAAELLRVAEQASAALCYPFIRIDLYNSTRGVILGELTPGPGKRHEFNPEWDERMSNRWHEAARKLEGDLQAGRITPLFPEADEARQHASENS